MNKKMIQVTQGDMKRLIGIEVLAAAGSAT
jgi:hypothetical protein